MKKFMGFLEHEWLPEEMREVENNMTKLTVGIKDEPEGGGENR